MFIEQTKSRHRAPEKSSMSREERMIQRQLFLMGAGTGVGHSGGNSVGGREKRVGGGISGKSGGDDVKKAGRKDKGGKKRPGPKKKEKFIGNESLESLIDGFELEAYMNKYFEQIKNNKKNKKSERTRPIKKEKPEHEVINDLGVLFEKSRLEVDSECVSVTSISLESGSELDQSEQQEVKTCFEEFEIFSKPLKTQKKLNKENGMLDSHEKTEKKKNRLPPIEVIINPNTPQKAKRTEIVSSQTVYKNSNLEGNRQNYQAMVNANSRLNKRNYEKANLQKMNDTTAEEPSPTHKRIKQERAAFNSARAKPDCQNHFPSQKVSDPLQISNQVGMNYQDEEESDDVGVMGYDPMQMYTEVPGTKSSSKNDKERDNTQAVSNQDQLGERTSEADKGPIRIEIEGGAHVQNKNNSRVKNQEPRNTSQNFEDQKEKNTKEKRETAKGLGDPPDLNPDSKNWTEGTEPGPASELENKIEVQKYYLGSELKFFDLSKHFNGMQMGWKDN